MLRKDIVSGFHSVLRALEDAQILPLLKYLIRDRDREDKKKEEEDREVNRVEALRRWSRAYDSFKEPARALVEILDLGFLNEDHFWLIAVGSGPGSVPAEIYLRVSFFVEKVPKIVELLRQEGDEYTGVTAATEPAADRVLSVLLVEDKVHSSPARIEALMGGVQVLYESCAEINQLPAYGLSVISCDAGSDKSFDFLGLAKVVEQVRKVILDMWDRVVFYREKKLAARLELLAQGLPIIEHISDLEKQEKLGHEQAEKLRRGVLRGVQKFMEAGAVIPEMEKTSVFPPRQLMAPEPKLLVEDTQLSTKPGDAESGERKQTPKPEEDAKLREYVEHVAREVLKKEHPRESGDKDQARPHTQSDEDQNAQQEN